MWPPVKMRCCKRPLGTVRICAHLPSSLPAPRRCGLSHAANASFLSRSRCPAWSPPAPVCSASMSTCLEARPERHLLSGGGRLPSLLCGSPPRPQLCPNRGPLAGTPSYPVSPFRVAHLHTSPRLPYSFLFLPSGCSSTHVILSILSLFSFLSGHLMHYCHNDLFKL